MWKGRGTDHTSRGCPDGAGQNGQVGEGEHSSQGHVLEAAEAAPPDWWCGCPGVTNTQGAQHRGQLWSRCYIWATS